MLAGTRLRGGSANSPPGAVSFATGALGVARSAGYSGTIVARADSGFYCAAFIAACRRAGAYFSVTARMDPAVKRAIASIPGDAWTPVKYPQAIWDDQLRCWVSDAEVAEVPYTAFASKKDQAVTGRLIVRRVRDLNLKADDGQGELFPAWRCHPVFTDSPFQLLQAEEQHRDHAVVEQVFADWTDGPMAHMPSGSFAANAAWLTLAAISCNLVRAAGCLASAAHARARGATIRRDLIDVAARTARRGRGCLTLHLPQAWHREAEWLSLFEAACARRGPGGLTSPNPVTAPAPQTPPGTRNRCLRSGTGQAAEMASGRKVTPRRILKITSRGHPPGNDHLHSRGGSRLSDLVEESWARTSFSSLSVSGHTVSDEKHAGSTPKLCCRRAPKWC